MFLNAAIVDSSNSEQLTFEILLVEDNVTDVYLFREAIKDNPWITKLHVANDGDDAIDFLQRNGSYAEMPRPDLVLLDLNLPGTHGREVLKAIKDDDSLKRIPVVILSSSQSDDDRLACYNLHANAFMTKALDFDELQNIVKALRDYWFANVKLPPH